MTIQRGASPRPRSFVTATLVVLACSWPALPARGQLPIPPGAEAGPPAERPRVARLLKATERLRSRIHLPPRWSAAIKGKVALARGYCTAAADAVAARLPGCVAPAFDKARALSPAALGSYCALKVKQDPAFLALWETGYGVLHNLEAAAMIACGVPAPLAIGLQEALEIPVNLGVIALRQHHLRADRSQSFAGTLRELGKEYRQHAVSRREENRRFMAERAEQRRGAGTARTARLVP